MNKRRYQSSIITVLLVMVVSIILSPFGNTANAMSDEESKTIKSIDNNELIETILVNPPELIEKTEDASLVDNKETEVETNSIESNSDGDETDLSPSDSDEVESNSTQQESIEQTETISVETTESMKETTTLQAQIESFTSTSKYFKVNVDSLAVFESKNGTLIKVATLENGESYPRISDFGNWHRIKYGNGYGYVLKSATQPTDGTSIKNLNSRPNSRDSFTSTAELPVFDNTSGALIKFATLEKGVNYPIVADFGNWLQIDLSGRLGFVSKSRLNIDFKPSDMNFKITTSELGVYINQGGKLVQVGKLLSGQEYQRINDNGNWHTIKFGEGYGYVLKASTNPSSGSTIKNRNTRSNTQESIIAIKDIQVYDNSSGALVPFATINKGTTYQIIGKSGSWYQIDVSGRLGYVHSSGIKLPFKASDKYFEVYEDNVKIYDSSTGSLLPVADLLKGQVYPRLSDFGNWHQIKYGNKVAYVHKDSTRPVSGSVLKNENSGFYKNSDRDFITLKKVPVYDNSTGKLIPFITLDEKQRYPIINDMGNWWRVDISGRIGYVSKSAVQVGPIFRTTSYNLSLSEMVSLQMGLGSMPQTDKYRFDKSYVAAEFIKVENNGSFPTKGTVTATTLNVREGAGTNFWIVGALRLGQTVEVLGKQGDWYEIKFGPWKNAKEADVGTYLNPFSFDRDNKDFYQFLVLSENAGIGVADLNQRILVNKGTLTGKGQAFIDASMKFKINEIYLISHALLETGNGKSALAQGVLVDTVDGKAVAPKVVYNMYGIAAYDSCPLKCGSEYAYTQGWFTPEAAIIGGADFISSLYVNNPIFKQDTLYKMRWNPENPGIHQYATDVGWAVKQVKIISDLYDLIDNYTLIFDIPTYN